MPSEILFTEKFFINSFLIEIDRFKLPELETLEENGKMGKLFGRNWEKTGLAVLLCRYCRLAYLTDIPIKCYDPHIVGMFIWRGGASIGVIRQESIWEMHPLLQFLMHTGILHKDTMPLLYQRFGECGGGGTGSDGWGTFYTEEIKKFIFAYSKVFKNFKTSMKNFLIFWKC